MLTITRSSLRHYLTIKHRHLDPPLIAPHRPWDSVPRSMRSVVRAYINGEKDIDKERAQELCEQYSLDYVAMRKLILEEMIAYSPTPRQR